jgi:hypothetical protein
MLVHMLEGSKRLVALRDAARFPSATPIDTHPAQEISMKYADRKKYAEPELEAKRVLPDRLCPLNARFSSANPALF